MRSWRVHIISIAILFFIFVTGKFIWDHPKVIIYVIFAVLALIAYGAIYMMVKTKVDRSPQ